MKSFDPDFGVITWGGGCEDYPDNMWTFLSTKDINIISHYNKEGHLKRLQDSRMIKIFMSAIR